jgi:hypothetical protein
MVVLAILGITLGVVGLAMRAELQPEPEVQRAGQIADARRLALESRRPVRLTLMLPDRSAVRVFALPDGRVLADTVLGLDPLTGRPRVAR